MKYLSKAEMEGKAVEALKKHPKVDKVHVTSDGQAFADEYVQAAQSYAKNNRHNKELSIQAFTRDQLAGKLNESPEKAETTPESSINDAESATAFLMGGGEMPELTYADLKNMVKWLEIKPENQQAATLTAALEAKRAELKSE